jgi:hypothetical protein
MTRELLLPRWLLHRLEAFRVGPFAWRHNMTESVEINTPSRMKT